MVSFSGDSAEIHVVLRHHYYIEMSLASSYEDYRRLVDLPDKDNASGGSQRSVLGIQESPGWSNKALYEFFSNASTVFYGPHETATLRRRLLR